MTENGKTVLRLEMAQWQGGDESAYRIGAQVLAAILPQGPGLVETVAVPEADGTPAPLEDGIKSRGALLAQLAAAQAAIARHDPDAIVTLGGDCLADLAPIAHLQRKYGDELAVIWVDAHPDVMTADKFSHAHAHVLAMLTGDGDAGFVDAVPVKVDPARVLYVGVNDMMPVEADYVEARGMGVLSPDALRDGPAPVLDWLRASGAKYVAVHFDLDVLAAAGRDFLLFNKPGVPDDAFAGIAQGRMELEQVIGLLRAVDAETPVVGLAVTEFLPWKMIELGKTLARLPLLGG